MKKYTFTHSPLLVHNFFSPKLTEGYSPGARSGITEYWCSLAVTFGMFKCYIEMH